MHREPAWSATGPTDATAKTVSCRRGDELGGHAHVGPARGRPLYLLPLIGLLYGKRMTVPRQGTSSTSSGRVNQKRRTRSAIIAGAQAILDRGDTPTVAQAAEEALVSRSTAYSYFPTQEALLLELTINFEVRELEELAAEPLNGSKPEDRVLELVEHFNRRILSTEKLCRTVIRHYMDAWLADERSGESKPSTRREGRRARWIETTLEPLRGTVPDTDLQRLQAALCLVAGGEAITVMRDVCRLDPDEAIAVTRWAAEAILTVGLQRQGRAEPRRRSSRSTAQTRDRRP